VHATLTQTSNKTLLKADDKGVKYLLGVSGEDQPDTSVLRVDVRANQQVALSQGVNDDGLFVLNFEDPRYLPFERTGAISSWLLEMPKSYNPIDFDTITDIIIRLQYTSLPGNTSFQTTVKGNLGSFNGYQTLLMAQRYASAWYSFIQQSQSLVFTVRPALFRPNLTNYKVVGITLALILTPAGEKITTMPTLTLTPGQGTSHDFELKKDANTGMVTASVADLTLDISTIGEWQFAIKKDTDKDKLMTPENVSNMVVSLQYTADFS